MTLRRNASPRRKSRPSATKAERVRLALLAGLPCMVCGTRPVAVHHLRINPNTGDHLGMSQRAPHAHTIPLCPYHHQTGPFGEAYHAGAAEWERRHGSQRAMWQALEAWLAGPRTPGTFPRGPYREAGE